MIRARHLIRERLPRPVPLAGRRFASIRLGATTVEQRNPRDVGRVPNGFLTRAALETGGLLLEHPAHMSDLQGASVGGPAAGVGMATHLVWMAKKDALGQDMALLGPPGPLRRRAALAYAQLMRREVEVLTLSRDTTEADLKQRRELVDGTVVFVDAPPVAAALHGRLLLVEGLERAERNILPLLNNLLENREMALEDGRFLVAPSRWATLMAGPDAATIVAEGRLVPVHPDFRVIVLGLPVPAFAGRPLDPPLRSRFSARFIPPADAAQLAAALAVAEGSMRAESAAAVGSGSAALASLSTHLAAFAASMQLLEGASQGLLRNEGGGSSGSGDGSDVLKAPGGLVSPAAAVRMLQRQGSGGMGSAAAGLGSGLLGKMPHFPSAALPSVLPTVSGGSGAGTAAAAAASGRLFETAADAAHLVFPFMLMPELHAPPPPPFDAGAIDSTVGRHIGRHTGGRDPLRNSSSASKGAAASASAGLLPPRFAGLSASFAAAVGPLASVKLPASSAAAVPTVTSAAVSRGFVAAGRVELLVQRVLASLQGGGKDVIIIGPQGSGKSAVAREVHRRLAAAASGSVVMPAVGAAGSSAVDSLPLLFPLHADMTARDLLQRRDTTAAPAAAAPSATSGSGTVGGTSSRWADSPLVEAAVSGRAVILDGVERLPGDTLAVLARLLSDREVDLPDGRRLVQASRYEALQAARAVHTRAALEDASPAASPAASPVGASGALTAAAGGAGAAPAAPASAPITLVPIHPSFRVVALATVNKPAHVALWARAAAALYPQPASEGAADASASSASSSANSAGGVPPLPFLHPEVMPLWHHHVMPALGPAEELAILAAQAPAAPAPLLRRLTSLARALRHAAATQYAEDAGTAATMQLSLRHLVRVARMVAVAASTAPSSATASATGSADLAGVAAAEILEALFFRALPLDAQALVRDLLARHGFPAPANHAGTGTGTGSGSGDGAEGRAHLAITIDAPTPAAPAGLLRIGDVALPIATPERPELVPATLFHAVPRHVAYLRDLLFDMLAGEKHVLLVGNQGTGKNKIVDALLQALRREREYVQLHRDSTVSSLTSTPTIVGGRVTWEDSPLVRAARHGRVLVVDELDKAPSETTAVLKALVEDGVLPLSDGRRLVDRAKLGIAPDAPLPPTDVPVHPDFAMFCLANRPGWPFLGNNVLTAGLAPCFSCHWIDNPDPHSELQLLRGYAPGVHESVLKALCAAFADLRALHDAGTLAYPYSTRESVAVAKHLQAYPGDPLPLALENVLAFDAMDSQVRSTLADVFARHGVEVSAGAASAAVEALLAGPMPTGAAAASVPAAAAAAALLNGASAEGSSDRAAATAALDAVAASFGADAVAMVEALEAAALRSSIGFDDFRPASAASASGGGAKSSSSSATGGAGLTGGAPVRRFSTMTRLHALRHLTGQASTRHLHTASVSRSEASPATGTELLPSFILPSRSRVWHADDGFFNPAPPPMPTSTTAAGAEAEADGADGASGAGSAAATSAGLPPSPFPILSLRLGTFAEEKSRFAVIDAGEQGRRAAERKPQSNVIGSAFVQARDRTSSRGSGSSAAYALSAALEQPFLFVLADAPLRLYAFRNLVTGADERASHAAATSASPASLPAASSPALPSAGTGVGIGSEGSSGAHPVASLLGALPERAYAMLDLALAQRVPWALGGISGFRSSAGGFTRGSAWSKVASSEANALIADAVKQHAPASRAAADSSGRGLLKSAAASALSLVRTDLWGQPLTIEAPSAADTARNEALNRPALCGINVQLTSSVDASERLHLPLAALVMPDMDAVMMTQPFLPDRGVTFAQLPELPLCPAAANGASSRIVDGGAEQYVHGAWRVLSLPAPFSHEMVIWRVGGAAIARLAVQQHRAWEGSHGLPPHAGGASLVEHLHTQVQILPLPAACLAGGGSGGIAVSLDGPSGAALRIEALSAAGAVLLPLGEFPASEDGPRAQAQVVWCSGKGGVGTYNPLATLDMQLREIAAASGAPALPQLRSTHALPQLRRSIVEVDVPSGGAASGHIRRVLSLPQEATAGHPRLLLDIDTTAVAAAAAAATGSAAPSDDAAPAPSASQPFVVAAHECSNSDGDVILVQRDGVIRIVQVDDAALARDAALWARVHGLSNSEAAAVLSDLGLDLPGSSEAAAAAGAAGAGAAGRSLVDVTVTSADDEARATALIDRSLLQQKPEAGFGKPAAARAGSDSAPLVRVTRRFADPAGDAAARLTLDAQSLATRMGVRGSDGDADGAAKGGSGASMAAAAAQLSSTSGAEGRSDSLVTSLPQTAASKKLKAQRDMAAPTSKAPPPALNPKRGKIDATGAPHVGGNSWAGGSGGSETAGLGGRGGPYRLDSGNAVHQLSDEEKAAVPDDVRARARAMAQEAFEARLREINMSAGEAARYRSILGRVRREVAQLRAVLEAADQESKERVWLRHQANGGELDDGKLVDALAGDRHVYKRRAAREEADPFAAGPPPKPRYVTLAVDVSGSMYRFNGLDGRLDRSLEVAAMVMEAFAGQAARFRYQIVGHSGDGPWIPFTSFAAPPATEKERNAVLEKMVANAQFCQSGDHTLGCAARGVRDLSAQDAPESDGRYLFLLSDANLARYGIVPSQLTRALTSNPAVQGYAVLISPGLGDGEADDLIRSMPPRRGFAVFDSAALPALFKGIFARRFGGGKD